MDQAKRGPAHVAPELAGAGSTKDAAPGPEPGTDLAKAQLGDDLKTALLHQREVEEEGTDHLRITYLVWALRIGRRRANDVVQVTSGRRWPTHDMLGAWDRESHFDGLLVMRGMWLHHAHWPSPDQLAEWDRTQHDPFVVGWRRRWFPEVDGVPAEQEEQSELGRAATAQAPLRGASVKRRWRSLVMVAVAVLVIGVLQMRDRLLPSRAATVVSITTPREGADVCYRQVITGTAVHLRDGEQLWLVVRPALDAHIYPQPGGAIVVSSDHRWSREAFLGTGADRAGGEGEIFMLDVVGASAAAAHGLAAYLTTDYPAGLASLPAGSRILTTVQVRRAGC